MSRLVSRLLRTILQLCPTCATKLLLAYEARAKEDQAFLHQAQASKPSAHGPRSSCLTSTSSRSR